MSKIEFRISSNEGYRASDVKNTMTVGELIMMLEAFDEDAEIVLYDSSNRYGACYGKIRGIQ